MEQGLSPHAPRSILDVLPPYRIHTAVLMVDTYSTYYQYVGGGGDQVTQVTNQLSTEQLVKQTTL